MVELRMTCNRFRSRPAPPSSSSPTTSRSVLLADNVMSEPASVAPAHQRAIEYRGAERVRAFRNVGFEAAYESVWSAFSLPGRYRPRLHRERTPYGEQCGTPRWPTGFRRRSSELFDIHAIQIGDVDRRANFDAPCPGFAGVKAGQRSTSPGRPNYLCLYIHVSRQSESTRTAVERRRLATGQAGQIEAAAARACDRTFITRVRMAHGPPPGSFQARARCGAQPLSCPVGNDHHAGVFANSRLPTPAA